MATDVKNIYTRDTFPAFKASNVKIDKVENHNFIQELNIITKSKKLPFWKKEGDQKETTKSDNDRVDLEERATSAEGISQKKKVKGKTSVLNTKNTEKACVPMAAEMNRKMPEKIERQNCFFKLCQVKDKNINKQVETKNIVHSTKESISTSAGNEEIVHKQEGSLAIQTTSKQGIKSSMKSFVQKSPTKVVKKETYQKVVSKDQDLENEKLEKKSTSSKKFFCGKQTRTSMEEPIQIDVGQKSPQPKNLGVQESPDTHSKRFSLNVRASNDAKKVSGKSQKELPKDECLCQENKYYVQPVPSKQIVTHHENIVVKPAATKAKSFGWGKNTKAVKEDVPMPVCQQYVLSSNEGDLLIGGDRASKSSCLCGKNSKPRPIQPMGYKLVTYEANPVFEKNSNSWSPFLKCIRCQIPSY